MSSITNWDTIEEQIIYFRTHLDMYIESAFAPDELSPMQHVIARAIGNKAVSAVTAPRGYGKSWLIARIAVALGSLYPGTPVLVVAPTARQATIIADKIRKAVDENKAIRNEIRPTNAKTYVSISKDTSFTVLKNGSTIKSLALESVRGERAKVVIVDEARDIDFKKLKEIVIPTTNETRYNARTFKFEDYTSKIIYISSACHKSLDYYTEFRKILQRVAEGNPDYFACAFDYHVPIQEKLQKAEYFLQQKEDNPESVFRQEYESIFLGETENAVFPFDLVQSCRTLSAIETFQPKDSKSRYIISLDIATSKAKGSDNSILIVHKFDEMYDGSFNSKIVCIRSYNGKAQDFLANEVRMYAHVKFPNTEKIVYDARGVGDGFDRFFDKEWVDISTGKEYPPLAVDDEPLSNPGAVKLLHPFRAINTLNQRIYTNLKIALEKKRIEIPASSRIIRQKLNALPEEQDMPTEEFANYVEADALQTEMGNIVAKPGANGNFLYDVPKSGMHKDRYSSLAMGNDYIRELEKENIKRFRRGTPVMGIVSKF